MDRQRGWEEMEDIHGSLEKLSWAFLGVSRVWGSWCWDATGCDGYLRIWPLARADCNTES